MGEAELGMLSKCAMALAVDFEEEAAQHMLLLVSDIRTASSVNARGADRFGVLMCDAVP